MPGWLWFLLQFLVIGGLFAYIIISSKKAMACVLGRKMV